MSPALVKTKKSYPGLDLLKFIMAIAVVAIHVKPFETSSTLSAIFRPLLQAAVPVFFLISAFLLFEKIERNKLSGDIASAWLLILQFTKRIGILYLVWFIIDIPFIIANKGYFTTYDIKETITIFIKDLFFGTTFPGSWFLSALVVSVVLVYASSQLIGKWGTFFIALIISIYVAGQELLPVGLRNLYDWYSMNVRKEVNCSFPFALVWVSIGQLLASTNLRKVKFNLENNMGYLLIGICLLYCIMALFPRIAPFFNYLFVPLLLVLALSLPLKEATKYRFMRNASILIFFFHFSIAGKKGICLDLLGSNTLFLHIMYFLLVVMISFLFATVILKLERNKTLRFLRYLH